MEWRENFVIDQDLANGLDAKGWQIAEDQTELALLVLSIKSQS